ncbi:uncharacterized protein LOC143602818 [Bidens hawaiensis]|uniref:uncharacterized protein LOC143602818 n=1 Tax=Bidens hawaiensis TaxID=980011 RepID=UPI00404ABB14
MEGIGSRTGRQSSRYGSAPVLTGPVRRWQKQWVHVSSSSSSNTSYKSNNSKTNNNNNGSTVRIRRWTPVPAGEDSEAVVGEERPRRKLRYAPIVVFESKKKEAEKSDVDIKEGSKTSQSAAQGTSENDDNEKGADNVLAAKAQVATKDLNNRPMDLDTGDDDGDGEDDDDEDHDLGGADKDKAADWVNAAQKGFAS